MMGIWSSLVVPEIDCRYDNLRVQYRQWRESCFHIQLVYFIDCSEDSSKEVSL